jgi:RNA polymerase sigma factor (TIGR02999 family)
VESQGGEITRLLVSWRQGDRSALEELWPLIRTDLLGLARRHLKGERRDHTIQPSSLVQETFLRLKPEAGSGWHDRTHFYAVVSQIMRHVLVDHARRRLRQKRGSGAVHVPIDEAVVLASEQIEQIVTVDVALQRLAKLDERKCRVLEMRFFGGLTVEEVAEVLSIAPNTVIRDWNFARAWLKRELGNSGTIDRGTVATD